MSRNHQAIKYDLVIGITLTVLGLTSTIYSYANVRQQDSNTLAPIAHGLQKGKTPYGFFQNDECIGYITSVLQHSKGYNLSTRGELRSIIGKNRLNTKLEIKGNFNPLGQLTNSELSIESPVFAANIKSVNVNPISIEFTAHSADKSFNYKFQIPGPVVIEDKDEEFTIRYSNAPGRDLQYFKSSLMTFPKFITIRKIPDTESTHCTSGAAAVDLTKLTNDISAATKSIPNLPSFLGVPLK